jgi:hypothetical protein
LRWQRFRKEMGKTANRMAIMTVITFLFRGPESLPALLPIPLFWYIWPLVLAWSLHLRRLQRPQMLTPSAITFAGLGAAPLLVWLPAEVGFSKNINIFTHLSFYYYIFMLSSNLVIMFVQWRLAKQAWRARERYRELFPAGASAPDSQGAVAGFLMIVCSLIFLLIIYILIIINSINIFRMRPVFVPDPVP